MRRDPRFPDRPEHPDFDRLSQAVIAIDAEADSGVPVDEITGVDPASLGYMTQQRILRAMYDPRMKGGGLQVLLGAVYLDAFTLGKRYAEMAGPGSAAVGS